MVEADSNGVIAVQHDKSILRSPNRDFFKRYSTTKLPGCNVFLMRHATSNLNEKMRAHKSSIREVVKQEVVSPAEAKDQELQKYREIIFNEGNKDG